MENGKVISLKNEDVLGFVHVPAGEKVYQSGPNQGKPFFWYRYGGKIVVVGEELHNAMQEGTVAQLNLVETAGTRKIKVLDEVTGEESEEEQPYSGYQVDGFFTFKTLAGRLRNTKEVVEAQAELDMVRAQATKALQALEL